MLTDRAALARLDPQDMLGRISEFPEQCQIAWDNAGAVDLPECLGDVDSVAIFGMGGSAIGADLVRALTEGDARVPITVVRDYQAPAWVGPRTLAITMSHSGTTEETIAAIQSAIAQGARPLAITSGGAIGAIVSAASGPIVPVRYPSQPRAALAHLFLPLLRTLGRIGIVADRSGELGAALESVVSLRDRLMPEAGDNEAMALANWLVDGLPAIVGAGYLVPVALRWKGQMNENGKGWALTDPLPEMNHNGVVGFANPPAIAAQLRVVFLDSPLLPERIRTRARITTELLDTAGVAHWTASAPGTSLLADQLSLIHLGDWTSYYIAILRGIDPTPVAPIDRLKAALAG